MSYNFKGRGFLQTTGKNNHMSQSNMNTINLSPYSHSILGSSPLTSNLTLSGIDFSDETSRRSSQIKKVELYQSPEDILTLSCALQRLRKSGEYGLRVLDDTVLKKVSQDDKDKAIAIRDYYSKKIMMGNLTDKLYKSQFRRDLATFIVADGKVFKDPDIGMACYLPDFYDYDVSVDGIKLQVNQALEISPSSPSVMQLEAVNLTPLEKIKKKTKNRELVEYWFKDDKLNAAVKIVLDPKNQLLKVWDGIFNNSPTLSVSGIFHRIETDGFEYFKVTSWDLTKA